MYPTDAHMQATAVETKIRAAWEAGGAMDAYYDWVQTVLDARRRSSAAKTSASGADDKHADGHGTAVAKPNPTVNLAGVAYMDSSTHGVSVTGVPLKHGSRDKHDLSWPTAVLGKRTSHPTICQCKIRGPPLTT